MTRRCSAQLPVLRDRHLAPRIPSASQTFGARGRTPLGRHLFANGGGLLRQRHRCDSTNGNRKDANAAIRLAAAGFSTIPTGCRPLPLRAAKTRLRHPNQPRPCIRSEWRPVVIRDADWDEIGVFWGGHRRVRPLQAAKTEPVTARPCEKATDAAPRRRRCDRIDGSITPACRTSCRRSSARRRGGSRALRPP